MRCNSIRLPEVPRLAGLGVLAALWVALATGCGSNPYAVTWDYSLQDTVVLYSVDLPDLNLPSAFNFHQRLSYRVEDPNATGLWDLAVGTRNGQIVLLPPEALGVPTGAGIAVLPDVNLEQAVEAPRDTTVYSKVEPVPVHLDTVYVIRSAQTIGVYGTSCRYYSKLEPLAIDPADGTLQFRYDSNPVCNSRALVPNS